jgi:hypothetical protein
MMTVTAGHAAELDVTAYHPARSARWPGYCVARWGAAC